MLYTSSDRPKRAAEIDLDSALVEIAEMDRGDLIQQLKNFDAPFPIDFTADFLATQSLDRLRHIFAGLVMQCRRRRVPIYSN